MRITFILAGCLALIMSACGGLSTKCQGSNCGIVGGDGGNPDMAGSAAPSYGCAGKFGFKPDPNPQSNVWACPGEFAAGVIRQRCAVGFKVCGGQPLVTERCSYNNPNWQGWGDFVYEGQLVADNDASDSSGWDPLTAVCVWSKPSTQGRRGVGACGSVTGFGAVLQQGLPACVDPTSLYIQCWNSRGLVPQNKWSCPAPPGSGDADFELIATTDYRNGVLCCPAG